MSVNLQEIRENKGLNRVDFAKLLNTEWEKDYPDDKAHFSANWLLRNEQTPGKISYDELSVIAAVLGTSPDQLMRQTKQKQPPRPISIENNWEKVANLKKEINGFNDRCTNPIGKAIIEMTDRLCTKPRVVFLGRNSSGKSSIVNLLLGKSLLPTNVNATTSSIVIIKHLSDRPKDWPQKKVFVLPFDKQNMNLQDFFEKDDSNINWQDSGDYDLLASKGTYNESEHKETPSYALLTFVDSPILYNCDLIDFPGFDSSESENDNILPHSLFESSYNVGNVFVYLSTATNFLSNEDKILFESIAKKSITPTYALKENGFSEKNLFVVATHACNIASTEDPAMLIEEKTNQIWRNIGFIMESCDIYRENFVSRFFFTDIRSDEMNTKFINAFIDCTKDLVNDRYNYITQRLKEEKENQLVRINNESKQSKENNEFLKSLHNLSDSRYQIEEKLQNLTYEVSDDIDQMNHETVNEFYTIYNDVISPTHIKGLLSAKDKSGSRKIYNKNKKDITDLFAILNYELESRLENTLKEKISILENRIKRHYIEIGEDLNNVITFKEAGLTISVSEETPVFATNYKGNVNGVSLLPLGLGAALGFAAPKMTPAFFASAALAPLASAALAPILLGTTLATLGGIATITSLGGNWDKTASSKIIAEFKTNGVLDKYTAAINDFWTKFKQDSRKTLSKEIESIKRELNDLLNNSSNHDMSDKEAVDKKLEEERNYFENLFESLSIE